MKIEVEYQHDEKAHEQGTWCGGCEASIAALPVYIPTCPDCGGHEEHIERQGILVGWITCVSCGRRVHGQSGRVEPGNKR
jgi:predicted RNA-binding Zn-ribbon protein involved in translation (DUF1610 family)